MDLHVLLCDRYLAFLPHFKNCSSWNWFNASSLFTKGKHKSKDVYFTDFGSLFLAGILSGMNDSVSYSGPNFFFVFCFFQRKKKKSPMNLKKPNDLCTSKASFLTTFRVVRFLIKCKGWKTCVSKLSRSWTLKSFWFDQKI